MGDGARSDIESLVPRRALVRFTIDFFLFIAILIH